MRSTLAKVLNPVCGRTMIGHVLAAAEGITPAEVMVVTAPDADVVRCAVAPVPTCIQVAPRGIAR
jgi:bifunctional UDP-N-acetylglucosamine pyrophosphorylase/glucosamine-1-phosphate N-acetyltransferase